MRNEPMTDLRVVNQKRVKQLINYDSETGVVTWKVTRSKASAGNQPSHIDAKGYRVIGIDSKVYRLHRIIWLWVYGYLPENEIDHINRDKLDNRLCNLREVTKTCNMRNRAEQCNNSSSVTGVCFDSFNNTWMAYIKVNGNHKTVGRSKDKIEAIYLRYTAEKCLNWGECLKTSSAAKYLQGNGLPL